MIGGQTFTNFWFQLGWLDTTLVWSATQIVLVLCIGTVFTVFLVILRLERILVSRVTGPERSNRRSARGLLASDPLVVQQVTFTGAMVGLLTLTGGTHHAQGRYWLPLLPAVVYATVVYVPGVLRRPERRDQVSRALLIGLLLYCAIATAPAVRSCDRATTDTGES